MVNQLVEQQLGLSRWSAGRLAQLLLLAVSVLSYSVMSMAVANSLFVSHVGAANLPIAFILIGLISMPAYAVFSQVVDRYSRPQLFRYALLGAIAMMIGLRLLLNFDSPLVYYALLIIIFFQWDFHNNILYASLLTDYLTTLEYKRDAPYIGIAQAIGTLIGGGLTALLSHYLATPDLLLYVPIVFAIAIAQLFYLETSQQRLDTAKTQSHVSLKEALQTFPDLVQRYPLVMFLAGSSFLLVIIYVMSEFLWFNIYAQHFTNDSLTGFLGFMRIIVSVVQIAVLFCFTRPLLLWLGVARMNVVYPLTTLASFIGLVFQFKLGSAIALQLNGDALYKSINLPVHQLNYNAVPREFLGRVRALSDGFIYAIGLTLAGVLLLITRSVLDLVQIAQIAIGLVGLLLLLRIPMGKLYAQGLEEMIRAGTVELARFSPYQHPLSPQLGPAVREFLTNSDRYIQLKGLEMAANVGQPSQFFADIQPLLTQADTDIRRAIVKLYSHHLDANTIPTFEPLLTADQPALRTIALEVLIANHYRFDDAQLQTLLESGNAEMSALAAVAATQMGTVSSPIQAACEQVWQTPLDDNAAQAVVRAIAGSKERRLAPLLKRILATPSKAGLKRQALEALATLARPGDEDFAQAAIQELEHDDPLVRGAAFNLLGVARSTEVMPYLKPGLSDPDPRVRERAAHALASYGNEGLALAQANLASPNPAIVRTAIAAIGQVRTRHASNLLFDYLTPDFQQVSKTLKWQQQIPPTDPNWQPLRIAINDYHQRLVQHVLYVLSCMGHSRTVNTVNQILNTTQQTDRANAVEVLASLSDRRFVLPLMPILEQMANPDPTPPSPASNSSWLRTKGYALLLETLKSHDRWVRIGGLMALATVPSALVNDPDPFVKTVASQVFPIAEFTTTSSDMNRLLLLKNINLFKNLSLDELLLIDEALEQEQVFQGQIIFSEGSWSNYFYIIAAGCVQLVKQIDGEQREIKQLKQGQHFGEVALFDDAPRWDGAIALEDCVLLKLDKTRFISLITQRPHIILEICRVLSQRLRETDHFRSTRKILPPEEISLTN